MLTLELGSIAVIHSPCTLFLDIHKSYAAGSGLLLLVELVPSV